MLTDKPKIVISHLDWRSGQKDFFLHAVDNFPPRLKLSVCNWILTDDSETSLIRVVNVANYSFKSYKEAFAGEFSSLEKIITKSVSDPDWDFGNMAVPVMLDVLESIPSVPVEVKGNIFKFLSQHSDRVPHSVLRKWLAKELLFWVGSCDVLAALKRAYFAEEPSYDGGFWAEDLLEAIKQNSETLGKELMLAGNAVAPTVSNWLSDFESHDQLAGAQHDTYATAQYLNSSDNAKKLESNERVNLQKLVAVYQWLKDPYVSREDAEELGLLESSGELLDLQDEISDPGQVMVAHNPSTTSAKPPLQSGFDRAQPLSASPSEWRSQGAKDPVNPKPLWEDLPVPKPLHSTNRQAENQTNLPAGKQFEHTATKPKPDVDRKLQALRQRMIGREN